MSKLKDIVKGVSPTASSEPAPADSVTSASTEFQTDVSADKAEGPAVAAVEAPENHPPVAADSSRPTLADLKKAAYEGREFELSKAVAWAPDYVPGTGFYADGARRYSATAAHNAGEAALEALATDARYLVRLV